MFFNDKMKTTDFFLVLQCNRKKRNKNIVWSIKEKRKKVVMQQTEVIIWIKKYLEAVNVHGYTITEYLLPPIHESLQQLTNILPILFDGTSEPKIVQ